MTTNDFKAGDTVYEAAAYFGPAGASAYITEATVVLPDEGVIKTRSREVRAVLFGATIHATMQEAREAAAARIREHAERLLKTAADLAEPRVVTV